MSAFLSAIARLFGQVALWIIVQPWEQCLRVRFGKRIRKWGPGFHWRLPILDSVFKQSVRARTSMLPTQTLSTADGATVVVSATLGYSIADLERLYQSLHHAEDTVQQLAAAEVAKVVLATKREAATPEQISQRVSALLAEAFAKFGLADVTVRVTDFAFIRAFRVVTDRRWGGGGESLDTKGHA